MANNVAVTAGTGTTMATDDAAGVHIPLVKLVDGTEDSTARIPGDATNGLDVDVTRLPALVAGTAAIGKLAANTGVDIGDVDVLSVVPGTGATNLGKIEDAAHTTGDVGVMMLGIRNDAGTVLAGTTLDYIPLSMDANGAVRVTGGGGGTQYVEDVAHVTGDTGTMFLAVRQDSVSALAGTTGDYIPLSTDASGFLRVNMAAGSLTLDGENHIGEVGGSTVIITPTITVTAGAYSAADVIGGEITLTNAMRVSSGSGILQSLVIETADGELPTLTFMFYESDPAANVADNGAFAWGAGDIAKFLGKVDVAAADFIAYGGDGVATIRNIGLPVVAAGSANLFCYIIANGTPTFAATTDLVVRFGFLQD